MRSRFQVTSDNKSPCLSYALHSSLLSTLNTLILFSSATEIQAALVISHGGKDFCGRRILGLKLGVGFTRRRLKEPWTGSGDPAAGRGSPLPDALGPGLTQDLGEGP